MSYTPTTDFIALARAVTGGVQKGEIPGLDLIVNILSRSGLFYITISATEPVANQAKTMWFVPATPSYSSEGTLKLWNGAAYVTATPELFNDYLAAVG
jgi:hypothetical protein